MLRDGEVVPLPPKTVDLLVALVENNGNLLIKDELMQRVRPDSFVEEANLSNHVFILRKALGENKNGKKYIETIPRRGYRFVANVTEIQDEPKDILVTEHARSHITIEEEQEFTPALTLVDTNEVRPRRELEPIGGEILPRGWARLRIPVFVRLTIVLGIGVWFTLPRSASKPPQAPMTMGSLTTVSDDEFDPALSPDGKLIA